MGRVSSRMEMESNRELYDLMVTFRAMLWTDLCCLCCQLSGVGLSSVIKAFSRVYSLLFTLLASTLLSWMQFNYSATLWWVFFSFGGSSSPHEKSLGTLFLDTNIHKLLEHKIKGGVPLSSFQCSHCVCMLKPARELEPEKGEEGETFVQRYLSLREAHKRWCEKRHQVEYKPPLLLRNANKNPLLY